MVTPTSQRNVASMSRTGVGGYQVTMTTPASAINRPILVTARVFGSPVLGYVTWTSTTVIELMFFDLNGLEVDPSHVSFAILD